MATRPGRSRPVNAAGPSLAICQPWAEAPVAEIGAAGFQAETVSGWRRSSTNPNEKRFQSALGVRHARRRSDTTPIVNRWRARADQGR